MKIENKKYYIEMKKHFLIFAVLMITLCVSFGTALADYSFTYVSNDGSINLSGILNTPSNGPGPLIVTGGHFTGIPYGPATLYPGNLSGLEQTSPLGAFDFDNVLSPGSAPMITYWGLLFTTGSGAEINIWGNTSASNDYTCMEYTTAGGDTADKRGTFTVTAIPILTVLKSASPGPSVNPGQVITYTILVTNTAGTATSIVVTDSWSPYVQFGINSYGTGVAFQFMDGSPSSGLTLGTPVYSNNNGSTWTYTPVSGGGGAPAGYDGNVTNWQIPMTSTMNANGANFTIKYQVLVK